RALSQEFRGVRACCVDLTETDLEDERSLGPIARMLASEAGEDGVDIAYRAARRYVRELAPASLPLSVAGRLRTHGVYCIVGGAGGLGQIFARHLASRYSARLLLTGRSPAGPK